MSKYTSTYSLLNKNVLLTGGAGYLGEVIAFALAEVGAHVFVNGRSECSVHETVAKINRDGGSSEAVVFDITNDQAVKDFITRVKCLDVIVNNAYSGRSGSTKYSTTEDFRNSYEISVVAAHNLFKISLPALRRSVSKGGYASIINIASMYGIVSPDFNVYSSENEYNPPFYGAAKAALIHWTKYLACEYGGEGIRINALSPGPFPSESVKKSSPEFIRSLEHRVPMKRVGCPDDLVGPVLFLASNASSYVNGTNLIVDGGWTCK